MLIFFGAWKWPDRGEILKFAYLMPLHMSTIYSTTNAPTRTIQVLMGKMIADCQSHVLRRTCWVNIYYLPTSPETEELMTTRTLLVASPRSSAFWGNIQVRNKLIQYIQSFWHFLVVWRVEIQSFFWVTTRILPVVRYFHILIFIFIGLSVSVCLQRRFLQDASTILSKWHTAKSTWYNCIK